MDDVSYETLAALLAREGALPSDRAIALMREAARTLADAHAAGILHGDLRPDTLLVASDGRVLLAESALARRFGEARQPDTPATERLASPLYYPPEAAHGLPLDARTDLFLLGATFYHAMTGGPPFDAADPEARALRYIRQEAPPLTGRLPGTPVVLNVLMQRLLRRNPDERYPSASELLDALERIERLVQKRQAARTVAPAALPPEAERRPRTQRLRPGAAPPRTEPVEDEASARRAARKPPVWQSKPAIYGAAAAAFLLLVAVLLILRSAEKPLPAVRVNPLEALPAPMPPPPPEPPRPEPAPVAPPKREPEPPPPPKTSVAPKSRPPSLEERLEAIERERKERKGRGLTDGDDAFTCHAIDGTIEGVVRSGNQDQPHYEARADRDCIGFWNPQDSLVKWQVTIKRPGTYQVEILFAAEDAAAGNEYVVSVAGQELRGTVRRTANWGTFETDNPGAVTIEKAGDVTVLVKAGRKKSPGAPLMNLRAVRLRRVNP
ncbi:MAG TPA: protein kinase [Planctomycetota bacterium]|nr:protein kinase [Planctomycetota bacterium]HRR79073.1 protein kinase [Planctomycetota bacterium]HRT93023.1 protein kinase [Planctomycetota bacterium]